MNWRTAIFMVRKDLRQNLRLFLLVVIAVGIGGVGAILFSGIMDGVSETFSAIIIDISTAHIVITPKKEDRYLKKAYEIKKKVEILPEVKSVSMRLLDKGTASTAGEYEPINIIAINPTDESKATIIVERVLNGKFLSDGDRSKAILGSVAADKLSLKTVDNFFIRFSNGVRRRFQIKGIYSSGVRELDESAYITLDDFQSITNIGGMASEIIVRLNDGALVDTYRDRIERRGIDGIVETWKERARWAQNIKTVFGALRATVLILSIIAGCVATAVLMYTNIQRQVRAIGILKAIGAQDKGVLKVYVLEGLIIGVCGSVIGNIIGSLLSIYVTIHPLPANIPEFTMPVKGMYSLSYLILPTATIMITTTLASFYPAWRAARINIIEAIWHG